MIASLAIAVAVAVLASGGVLITWRRYGALVREARDGLAGCPEVLEMRYRIVVFGCGGDGNADRGNVVPLPVRPRLALLHPGLRAAA